MYQILLNSTVTWQRALDKGKAYCAFGTRAFLLVLNSVRALAAQSQVHGVYYKF